MSAYRKRKSETCVVCNRHLVGKRNQVYCGTDCKNLLREKVRKAIDSKFGRVNKRVFRNITILEGIILDYMSEVKIHKDTLFEHGFDISGYQDIKWCGAKRNLIIGNFSVKVCKDGMLHIKRIKKTYLDIEELKLRWDCELIFVIEDIEGNVRLCVRFEILDEKLKDCLSVRPFLYEDSGPINYISP